MSLRIGDELYIDGDGMIDFCDIDESGCGMYEGDIGSGRSDGSGDGGGGGGGAAERDCKFI